MLTHSIHIMWLLYVWDRPTPNSGVDRDWSQLSWYSHFPCHSDCFSKRHEPRPKWIDSVQSLSQVRLFATPWTAARQASLSITKYQSSSKPMSIELVMPSSHLILCHHLYLLPQIPPRIRVFSNESAPRIRWPNYWSLRFNISPSNEHSALISLRMDWLDFLAVQGTLKSLLQHHSSKASILWHLCFFISNSHIHTWPLEKP